MARSDGFVPVSNTGSNPAKSRRLLAIVVLGVLPVFLAAAWVVVTTVRIGPGLGQHASLSLLTVDRPFPAEGRFRGDPYIGSKACALCHPGESALHARSGHAATLLPASHVELARRLDGVTVADPERSDVRWAYRARDGRLEVSRADGQGIQRWIVQYAFGSGRHATTFVNILDPDAPAILEHRLTYYTGEGRLGVTPGQGAADSPTPEVKPHGKELAEIGSRKCFGCHATQLSARDDERIDERTMIPNVSCERCHGPGRAHVERASRKAPAAQLTMPFGPNGWSSESQMMMCGSCHRHPSRARPGQIRRDDPHLARFQPVGIMESRCYRESGGAISCNTCHDPHARASSDAAWYNAKCLSCHSSVGPGEPKVATQAAIKPETAPAACPVSPQVACVSCHMPRVDSGQHVLYTDHWIRIRGAGDPPATSPTRRSSSGP